MLSDMVAMFRRRGSWKNLFLLVLVVFILIYLYLWNIAQDKKTANDRAVQDEDRRESPKVSADKNTKRKVAELHEYVYQEPPDRITDDDLVNIFIGRLSSIPKRNISSTLPDCSEEKTPFGACFDRKCPPFSSSPEVRLRQILSTRSRAYQTHLPAVVAVNKKVPFRKYILVSAVSANHYNEMQALVKNLKESLFTRLHNYTFVLFDLGLTKEQRRITEINCHCIVVDFPFRLLPPFFKDLTCFTWKVFIVRALLQKSEFLLYMDASIRWNPKAQLDTIFRRAKKQGLQVWGNNGCIATRASLSTINFYGDLTCQYARFTEAEIGIGVYHNQPFVRKAILDPWVACAFNDTCMCLKNYANLTTCYYSRPRTYNGCHRFDQSSMSIIISKLYMEQRHVVWFPNRPHSVRRGDEADWFIDFSEKKDYYERLGDMLER